MMIILADAELELVPNQMLVEEDVKKVLEREGKENVLLDNYEMRRAISKHFPQKVNRIGFPDIAYMFWRLSAESTISKAMNIGYAIHTKFNVIIEQNDLMGIGPSYAEFKERVEKILLGTHRKEKIIDYLRSKGILDNVVVLHPKGKDNLQYSVNLNYVIGGFPEGDFSSDLRGLPKSSIYDRELTVPAVVELLHFGIFRETNFP
ncbi:MAG: hypothetical protein QXN66_05930 [Thermoplasmatales archaeon]